VPGNHDALVRDYCGTHFGGVEVRLDDIHETADGRRLWVVHGDAFDSVVMNARWLAVLGDWSYVNLLRINVAYNALRRALGLPYWSLSAYLKFKVKNAVQYIGNFETAVAAEARKRAVDGVVCGHIHHAEIRHIDGLLYVNDGDWVESCTAAVEDASGQIEIVHWAEPAAQPVARAAAA